MNAPARPKRWPRILRRCALVLLALLTAAYLLFTGPRHLDHYPPRDGSPYRLPWPAGQTKFCGQSNRGIPRMLYFYISGNGASRL